VFENLIRGYIVKGIRKIVLYLQRELLAYDIRRFRAQGHMVSIDRTVRFGANITLSLSGNGCLSIGRDSIIKEYAEIKSEGMLNIGENVYISKFVTIACRNNVFIGNNSGVAEFVSIRDHDHAYTKDGVFDHDKLFVDAPVIIENDVWIGTKATICKGVHIGRGTIVGANAVVTHDLPENCIAVGVPARVIKMRI